jgi:hypothetical protein
MFYLIFYLKHSGRNSLWNFGSSRGHPTRFDAERFFLNISAKTIFDYSGRIFLLLWELVSFARVEHILTLHLRRNPSLVSSRGEREDVHSRDQTPDLWH